MVSLTTLLADLFSLFCSRVLSERGVTKALGGKRGDAKNRAAPSYPYLCRQTTLPPFVDTDLRAALTSPNLYVPSASGAIAHGMKAETLPAVCNVWLKARDAGVLTHNQKHIAVGTFFSSSVSIADLASSKN